MGYRGLEGDSVIQAVTAIAKFVGWLVTAEGTLAAIARFAASILLSVVASKLFGPKLPRGVGLSAIQITTRSTTEFRKVVYGQALVSGPVAYNNTSGINNRDLWYVIPMCQGLSEDLVELRLDSDVIPKADIDWAAGSGASDGTGTGEVSTAKYLGTDSPASFGLRAYYYLGDDLQPAPGTLNAEFTDITSNFRLRGVTYVIFRLRLTDETENVWKEGVPGNFKAVIKGRLIYDSRKDSTNGGSGTHRFADDTTWEWSDNPALCVTDYLMVYMGVDPALSIDWPSVAAAADDCDVLVEIPPAASPSNTEKRFTCNGALSLGASHKDNIDSLLSSMDGRLSYVSGQWTLRASVWEAASTSIGEDDLAGDVSVQGSAPRDNRFNTVRGFYIDPGDDYQPVEFPLVSKSTYVSRDNGRVLDFELSLPFTNGSFMAQRIAFRLLEQGNNQEQAQLPLKAMAADIAVGDIIDLTVGDLSYSAKTFRVLNWTRDASTIFTLDLREDISASYDDPLVADYTTKAGGVLTPPADVVPPPSNLAAVAVDFGIKLTWVNPAPQFFELIEVYESDSSAWAGASKIAEVAADTITIDYTTAVQKWFWIRARKVDVLSLRDPDSDTSGITATPIIFAGGIHGFVEPENGIHWTRAPNAGAWTPSQLTTDLDCTFKQGDVVVARIARRVTLNSSDGTLTVGSIAHKGGDLNTGRVTVSLSGSGTTAVTVQFDYVLGSDTGAIAETVTSSQGGDDGGTGPPGGDGADGADSVGGFVEPENGLAWTRAPNAGAWTPSQLTTDLDVTFKLGQSVVARIARRITLTSGNGTLAATTTPHKGGDLNTSRVTVTVSGGGSTAITVQFDYSFSGDTGSAAATVESAQGGDDGGTGPPGGDGADGEDAISGIVEPENGLAWARATNAGAWTPSQLTSDIDISFFKGTSVVARIARRVTLTSSNGVLAASVTAHKGGDLNTGRVTVEVNGGVSPFVAATTITLKFDYSFGGDTGSASATLESVQGGDDAISGYLTNDAALVPCDGDGNNCDFSTANGEFKVNDGVVDETANATFSELSETNCTGTINTAVDTPVSGQPKGYYEITAITSSNALYKVRAAFGGVNIDKTFAITRTISPLSASVTPGNINESVGNGTINPIPNSSKTCTASGGTPSYTFQWVRVSGATQIIANSATSSVTTFRSTGTNIERIAVFRCDVDDAASSGPVQSNTFQIRVVHGTLP